MKTRHLFLILLFGTVSLVAQNIPLNKVIPIDHLSEFLKEDVKKEIASGGEITEAALANYFRQKFAERFFYDWRTVDERFALYSKTYDNQASHAERAMDHMNKYADSTQWVLPFNYLNGEEVNAYALRHLSRQHKMLDIAYQYFYSNKDPKYIRYFTKQMRSLNYALEHDAYEKIEDGNGVYENYRASYRSLNWLSIHNMFIGEATYADTDQLITIATLLQHGAHLFANNPGFIPGNHQTRGVSGLAMISILLRDFKGTEQWLQRALDRLEEHLSEEINADGFQSERSVHYHMNDIDNYYYVYQLAKISGINIGKAWEEKLNSLFTTLVKISYPDKTAPVLQDDTDNPWAEYNDISGVLTLGYLLFENPQFGYFVKKGVDDKMYWFLQNQQLDLLKDVQTKRPAYGSLTFPETKYYVMREGWDANDKMMIISAGLDAEKPSHQHGDMLGIQAIAYGQNILPNYQVRYSLADFDFFKNSLVKNVALADEELQGKIWTPNKGRTGYGQYNDLPQPTTIAWESNDAFDLFVGAHDGFKNINTAYSRQVIYVKNDFWIVKDNFHSDAAREYKQVWQGHYSTELAPKLIRSVFSDASGCDILQLTDVAEFTTGSTRGKQRTIISKSKETASQFITIVFPYKGYDQRINELAENPTLKGWEINELSFRAAGEKITSLSKGNKAFLFNTTEINVNGMGIKFSKEADLFVQLDDDAISIHSLGDKEVTIEVFGAHNTQIENTAFTKEAILKPGNLLQCKK